MIHDPEVRQLVAIANTLRKEYQQEKLEWRESPFRWLVDGVPSRTKGKIGEELVARWCTHRGFRVSASGDSEADLIVAGRRVEVKLSTLWAHGVFTFQQFRNQDYDYGICLGVSPFDVRCWVVPKNVLLEEATPQHGGRRGVDTKWLSFPPDDPPPWLDDYGGRLEDVYDIISGW